MSFNNIKYVGYRGTLNRPMKVIHNENQQKSDPFCPTSETFEMRLIAFPLLALGLSSYIFYSLHYFIYMFVSLLLYSILSVQYLLVALLCSS